MIFRKQLRAKGKTTIEEMERNGKVKTGILAVLFFAGVLSALMLKILFP